MSEYLTFQGTRAEAEQLIRQIPAMLTGDMADTYGIARRIQLRAGVALLSEVQRAFIQKSRGRRGSDGITWPPLKPETIARRRSTAAELKSLGIGSGPRPTLTPDQDRRWRQIFMRVFMRNRVDMGDKEAKAKAAAIAWDVVKKEGAKTKKELLGSRQVDILRDTGELLRSLTPGVDDRPSDADGQVFEVPSGRVIVGTNKKPWHHQGGPHLPKRLLWPESGEIPERWWPSIRRAIRSGIEQAVRELLEVAA